MEDTVHKTTPMLHQVKGQEFLKKNNGGALLFDCGLGKTKTVLDFLAEKALEENRIIWTLVMAPKAALDTWPQEAETHVPDSVTVTHEIYRAPMKVADRVKAIRSIEKHTGYGPGIHMVIINLDVFSQSHKVACPQDFQIGADGVERQNLGVLHHAAGGGL